VRAYDALTGELRWAWDTGRPGDTTAVPGRAFTLDTPNAWAVFAADPDLGLVYLPTGGAPPDYYGGNRRPGDEQFGSSVVALDVATGQVRWSFQTTHHDVWDYDIGAQPTLIDFPTASGPVPALIQATKTAQIFVLDRRTGQPLSRVEERPAPTGAAPGDHTAPTQPYSVGMPDVGGRELTDQDMWGLTPIDRLMCSLQFHGSIYKGNYTPPSVTPFIVYPGFAGGVDWGGVAVDTERGILIVNAIRFANRDHLVPRAEVERLGVRSLGDPGVFMPSVYPAAQIGTPFGIVALPWLSPLGLPCQRPPWGTLTAIDLKSRQVLWTRPLGTTHDSGPFGVSTHLAAPAGVPNQGGSVVTGGGLTFIAATLDAYLRAFDTRTGHEVWKSRLPAGGQSNPISYLLDGRQYVVVNAGGHGLLRTAPGDYLIAFALPAPQAP
jgi:membrane-bound PQQ-dependent dehydrogenase (glucose/quinate/shikimate family)